MSGDRSAECRISFSGPDLAQVDRLAPIVLRLDPHEGTDNAGSYSIATDG